MAELLDPDPTEYGRVVGRFTDRLVDDADPLQKPQRVAYEGLNVLFTPEPDKEDDPPIEVFALVTATPPETFTIKPLLFTTNEDGYVCAPFDETTGVEIPASTSILISPTGWRWRVEVWKNDDDGKVAFPRIAKLFRLDPGAQVDITALVSVPPDPDLDLEFWEQAVAQTEALRAETAAIRDQVLAFGGTNNQQVATMVSTPGPTREAVSDRVGAVTGSVSGLNVEGTPKFERLALTPLVTAAELGMSSIFWPSIIRAADYVASPLDNYYMYVSTDHGTAGGIWLLTAPKVTGPWVFHGQVYVDTIGQQTETADVHFIDGKFDMLYQQQLVPGRVANQVTLRATSPDGINWTRQGIAIDLPAGTAMLGEYHSGYQRRTRIGNRWVSRGLAGGSIQSKLSTWFSNDGKVWKWSGELDYGSSDLAENSMRRLDLNGYFVWRGRVWGYGRDTNSPASGGVILEEGFPCVGPVTNDWFTFAATPTPALSGAAGAWESTTDRGSYVFVDGATAYMFYQKGNSIGIARAAA